VRVGVLALQGGFAAHEAALAGVGCTALPVRAAADLEACDGLVLPGGESTTQLRLIDREPGFADALDRFVRGGAPVLATCAGLVLSAAEVLSPAQPSFGWLDVTVRRNGWGRQLQSSEAVADDARTELVLIRAPRIERVGPGVEVALTLHGEPVLVRQGNVWGATFHPELTENRTLHARVFGATAMQRTTSAAE